jgi:signal transduction histidine kinase
MRWSIRYQLLVPLLTLLLGVVGICAWTAVASARRAWQQIETQVRRSAQVFSESRFRLTTDVLQQASGLSSAQYVLVRDDGSRQSTLGDDSQALVLPVSAAEDWQSVQLDGRVTVGDEAYLCGALRLHRPWSNTDGTLYFLYPERSWRDALWEAVRPSLLLGSFVGLASLALAVGVAQRFSRRIQELGRRTRYIAAGNFSPVPLAGRNDELRDLAAAINDMAQRLEQLQLAVQQTERLRLLGQVSGGLAHQLRNGVTGAILAVQLHARECTGGADPEALDVALRQLTLLESNLKRFLDLGRTESPRRDSCSLMSLVEEALTLLRPQCRHAHIRLDWTRPCEPWCVAGDPGQLGHLFINVLGNAVEAAGPGGAVEVRLQRPEKPVAFCLLEVFDSGPGPSVEVAGRLFEPFVTSKRGGVGLGLAVARQVVEAHGGQLGWRREDSRTCFWIELPLLSSAGLQAVASPKGQQVASTPKT